MIVALTGGTGVLGGAILDATLAAGHQVQALIRPSAGRTDPARDGVRWIHGELADSRALDRLVAGADAVVHSAFADTDDSDRFIEDNIASTLRLLTRSATTAGQQFVFISSLAVYGTDPSHLPSADQRPLDEDFPLWPRNFYAAHKLCLEKMIVAGSGDLGVNTSAFRIGCVLGPYPDPSRDYLARFVAEARDTGAIAQPFGAYVITAADAARVVVDALGDASVSGQVFNTFDRWLDFAELAEPLRGLLGKTPAIPCPIAPAPTPAIRNDRLLQRAPVFGTDAQINALLGQLVSRPTSAP